MNTTTEKTTKDALYGKDAREWLARWDNGLTVWSVEMGGLGPGYEQAIQMTVAEILRHMLAVGYDAKNWDDPDAFKAARRDIEKGLSNNEVVSRLSLSGAQWGAALMLAARLYQFGPRRVLEDVRVDRTIQVCAHFPSKESA